MDNNNLMLAEGAGSRVQRAFNNAAFFWLDRNEFPLADFLQACTTHFLIRPDFTSDDAEFILKWIEQQRRNPKSTLNKTLRQQAKIGIETKDLQIVRGSLKAFMTKPKINVRIPAAKTTAVAKKSVKKAVKVKKVRVKSPLKKTKIIKAKTKKIIKKVSSKKVVNKKVLKSRQIKKISMLKKVKSSVKNAFLSSLKNKAKKRRVA